MTRTAAILISILLFILLGPIVNGYVEEFRWYNEKSHTMLWGDKIIVADHVIEFRDFSDQTCIFYIYHNGLLEDEAQISTSEAGDNTWVYDDFIQIRLNSMDPEEEKAVVTTWVGEIIEVNVPPKLEISITNEYAAAGGIVDVLVDVTNLADEPFTDVSVNLYADDFGEGGGSRNQTIFKLRSNSTKTLMFKLTAPGILEARNYTINVIASGWTNRSYHRVEAYKNIHVSSAILTKHIYPLYIVLNSEKNYATVTMSLINPSNMIISAYIEDVIPPGFEPADGKQKKSWFITVAPGSTTMIRYKAVALNNGDYIFPVAKAWLTSGNEHDLIYSKQVYHNGSIEVHGSSVIADKTVNCTPESAGDLISVNTTLRNIGDKTAFVWAHDTLPDGVELVSGEMEWEGILQSMQVYELSYVIRLTGDIDELILPNATVSYIDSKKNKGHTESNEVILVTKTEENSIDPDGSNMNTTGTNDSQNADDLLKNIEASIIAASSGPLDANAANLIDTEANGWDMTVNHMPGFDIFMSIIIILLVVVRRSNKSI